MAKEDKSPDSEKRAAEESEAAKAEGGKDEKNESKAADPEETDSKRSGDDADATGSSDEQEDEGTAGGDADEDSSSSEGEDQAASDDADDEDDAAAASSEDEDEDEEAKPHTTSSVEVVEKTPHSHPAPSAEDLAAAAHDHEDHGLAHTTTTRLLVAVFGALVVLTIATVAVTKIDLGGQGNLIVALVIATIKAGLVVAFFMHLIWDRKLNLLAFLSAVLFLILFLSLAITDRKEYQPYIDQFSSDNASQAK